MSVPTVHLNGISVSVVATSFRKKRYEKGKTEYQLFVDLAEDVTKVRLPNLQVMKRLAEKFLHCEYVEPYRRGTKTITFLIDSNLSKEDRVAFLGAVCVHCAPIRKTR